MLRKVTHYFSQILEPGAGALFFIQIFSTLSFAVLYSSLVLYMTQALQLSATQATAIMGGFVAFNFGLHLLGGYFGGRYLSFRSLFVTSLLMQMVACWILAIPHVHALYWGLALFLAGSGLNVTCVNMMLTQLYEPDDNRRETAFMFNYSGMNVGFFIGYTLAGYYQLTQSFHQLFLTTSFAAVIAILLVLFHWRKLRDRTTPLAKAGHKIELQRLGLGYGAIALVVLALDGLLHDVLFSNEMILVAGIIVGLTLLTLSFKQPNQAARKKIWAYLILGTSSLIFWALYQLAPMAFVLFNEYNVDRVVKGFVISPQWISNINTVIIVIGGPLFALLFRKIRAAGFPLSIPLQFSIAIFLIGVALLLLPAGIHFASAKGFVSFSWVFWCYVLISIGELCISPIGYAMVGRLAPESLQGIMMGAWLMLTGVASILSSYASRWAIHGHALKDPAVTNPDYFRTFLWLGVISAITAILLFLLIPVLRYLMKDPPAAVES